MEVSMSSDTRLPAAQYLRMSTDHQQFSIDNQADAIKRYAEDQGFEIIRTYIDEAKSGLALKHRLGLAKLLSDVVGGPQPFKAILVYDVSRWGRFQDADESAYYEFLCKSAGLLNLQRVHRKFFGKAHRSPVERVTQQPD
jgi:DNA invertase Pin-like site-specific DNA recombinase